jgi:hypothetical protein
MPAVTLLKELKRCEVVVADENNKLTPVKRYYIPSQSDPGALLRAGSVINDLGSTLYHNLYKAEPQKNKPLHFERRATNIQMSESDVAAFRTFVEQEGQAFLEKIDAWLTEREQSPPADEVSKKNIHRLRLGVGTYLIEHNFSETISHTQKN